MSENLLVVNAEGPETRVGVVHEGTLSEYFVESKRDRGIVGNIYRGRVSRVLPGMQAAFVDLGPTVERAGFLYVADILGAADERKLFADEDPDSDDAPEGTAARLARSRKRANANRKIEDLLKADQEVLVQVVKEPIGLKGARLTGYLSLPGRYNVFMPAVQQVGVSRRISSEAERRRLRKIVTSVGHKSGGFIVRTAAEGVVDQEIRDDVDYLLRLWSEIQRRERSMKGPGLIYADLDLVLRTIRDLLRADTKEIVIDDEEQYDRARKFTMAFLPPAVDRIKQYRGRQPIFDHYGVEAELRTALGRRVELKSGGSLVIDQGEALTAIDVNTGSFVGKRDLEETVTKNNIEACREVARQLRLRNIGGIIVIDFVDMDKENNRKKVWDILNQALASDRSRCNLTKISELGLVEMTRKRTRESLNQLLTEACPTCSGSGVVKSTTTVAHEVLREVRRLGSHAEADSIDVECAPVVADLLDKYERGYLDELEKKFQKKVVIQSNGGYRPDQYQVMGRGQQTGSERSPSGSRGRKRGRRRGGKSSSAS
ncbi:Rne/Rng family ribonuclease [Haliangium ochraceum]|uniref:Ribonuclease G n=1 Tax=Haliangium ochraceum (strain DSM 14365 / JCM 11303 / SMP-2) TaxID=502025 RepID=D0LZK2_HALO1|nr:Rne/Rng family ribonuclease [Haliangium ochraceum]ACY17981.1 ribonuclease, Rne/Rng family [Haliangium ochraceum DSM 14365]